MGNNFSVVNQKLVFAKIILGLLSQIPEQSRLDQQALLEAVVAHLYAAYRHYLYEILESSKVPIIPPITAESELIACLADAGKISAEANELLELSRESKTWLAQLLHQYHRLLAPAKPRDKSPPATNPQLISMIALTDEDFPPMSASDVQAWYNGLTETIARHRESSAEF